MALLNDLEVATVDQSEFEEVSMNWLTANRYRVGTRTTRRRLSSLRRFAAFAQWGSLFEEYSLPTSAKPQPHPIPEGMDGIRRMLIASDNEQHRTVVALCGFFGLRISEALSVRPSDFNFQEDMLKVRGKGDKERYIPISPEAKDWLTTPIARAYLNGNANVVNLSDRSARSAITRLGKKAKLQRPICSHDLRATFATAVYDKTLDQRVVQILLGHASGNTTEVYIGRTRQQLIDGVRL